MYQHNNNNEVRSIVNSRFSAPEGSTINGGAYDVSLAIGSSLADDRGNIVAYAGLRHENAITQDKYDYSICTLNPSGQNTGGIADFFCGGSGTPAVTRIGGISAANAALAGLPTASSYTITSTGARPFVSSDQFNFAPANYFRRPSTRYTAGVMADYEISENFNPYLDVMFMDYSTEAQIAPSGAFFGPRTVNCNNPFLTTGNPTVGRAICGAALGTAATATALIGKRNVEGGNRFNDIGFNPFRVITTFMASSVRSRLLTPIVTTFRALVSTTPCSLVARLLTPSASAATRLAFLTMCSALVALAKVLPIISVFPWC
jgi:hypothetical protein